MDKRWGMRSLAAVSALTVALAAGAGCGGDEDDEATPQSGDRETTTTAPAEPLEILVTNDDGVAAEGIDVLVTALTGLENVEVTVVAPATQQSGTGGNVTEGPLTTNEATTASGYEARAVEGFPADTIRVAFDELGLTPDLVVSGINEGQNLGPVVDLSGTVGAARAAARKGVPALAVSQGLGQDLDYEVAAGLVTDWIDEHLDALLAGEQPADVIANLNVPTCDTGEMRGLVEVSSGTSGNPLDPSDCASTLEDPTDDVVALANGFAALTEVAVEPGNA
jgi:5'-nucleotidase